MAHSEADRAEVRRLAERGASGREIAAATGIPLSTVTRWRRSPPDPRPIAWRPAHEASYAYLLGMYLGDGCLYANPRGGVQVRICLDTRHPTVIDDCWAAMVLPHRHSVALLEEIGCAAA